MVLQSAMLQMRCHHDIAVYPREYSGIFSDKAEASQSLGS